MGRKESNQTKKPYTLHLLRQSILTHGPRLDSQSFHTASIGQSILVENKKQNKTLYNIKQTNLPV